jgi:N utilization substance protein B
MAKKINQRHRARELAIQALYQWDMTGDSATAVLEQFMAEQNTEDANLSYFQKLVQGVVEHQAELDQAILPALDRELTELNTVELAALRLAVYEFVHCPDVPFKVVINEAVELTKAFGAQDGFKYVNGVLDKLAPALRAIEVQARKNS